MTIKAEVHSHTSVSAHAYSTLEEMVNYAAKNGIELLSITNHGPAQPDAPHPWHFGNLRVIPQVIDGVIVLKGIEANVLDVNGNLDLEERYLSKMDVVIASLHSPVYTQSEKEIITETYLNIAKNPYVDIIGHSGSDEFKYDYEKGILAFKEYNKAVELNNHSFISRPGSSVNCIEIAKLCKKHKVNVVVSSDAHISYQICKVDKILKILEEIDFPEELVLNTTASKFLNWLEKKKGRKILTI